MADNYESSFVASRLVCGIESRNSLESAEFIIDKFQRPCPGISTPSIPRAQITLESFQENSLLTVHSMEDAEWILSIDGQEWNHFVVQQLFDDSL